jgi:hypothetical protein
MSRIFNLFLICLFFVPSILEARCKSVQKTKSEQFFELKAGKSIMKISANGGRIISYSIGEKEILTQASEHENFGSTLWTSPQSDWGWPPYEVLDNQEYQVEQKDNWLKMTSNPDPKSGFQMIKTWKTIGEGCIEIQYRIKNTSDQPKSVGAWDVSRVPCGGLAFFPDGGKGKVPESNLKIDLQQEGINWISIDKKPISKHQKLFSTAKEGWLAYALNGLLFIKQFPDTKPEDYSPQQGEVEIYINKEKSYAELENQGPYQLLNPCESLRYQENWFLIPLPDKKMVIRTGNRNLIELVRQKIGYNPSEH